MTLISTAIHLIGCEATNNPPVIDKLEATNTVVQPYGTSELKCVASDPDGDALTFAWSADAGSIAGQGDTVTWTAPEKPGI